MTKHRTLVVRSILGLTALLWLSVLFSNSANYNGWMLLYVLPIIGVLVIGLAIYLKKWALILWGLALMAAFYITWFLGYLLLGP